MQQRYIDIGVNLVGSKLEHRLDTILQENKQHGVNAMVVISSDLNESADVINICNDYPRQLFATAGVHPHHASSWGSSSQDHLIKLVTQNEVVAIGECGLDFNRNYSPPQAQLQAFEQQLQIATELNKPVYMHCRDAHDEFIELVARYRNQLPKAVLHCFTGNTQQLQDCLKLDLHIGVTGWVCDERRGQELAEAVKHIPNDRILLETDSPYLIPRNLKPKPKSSTNYPKYLPNIAATIADLRGQPLKELAEQCYKNTLNFFDMDVS
ncbi:hydrolase TatD [Parashewanella curva]|uniref:Hydrolase TatD n=1 Tax=Parashewanella curva TaxID=2338552 RepID=A0A3L8Q1B1_9GAMM|nr:TatD family hydrolase [Parashewanella curva]RLV61364.1 hydrolase TatD [Parashewanella curva]